MTSSTIPTTASSGTPAPDPRAELIAGLRELADFYEQHPEMPIPTYPDVVHCVLAANDADGLAEMHQIAAALGVEAKTSASQHTDVNRKFRGLAYRAYYVARDRMRRHSAEQSYTRNVRVDEAQAEVTV